MASSACLTDALDLLRDCASFAKSTAGLSAGALEAAIRSAIELKPQQHEFREQPEKVIRFMAQTGG